MNFSKTPIKNSPYTLVHNDHYNYNLIQEACKKYNASYLGEFTLKTTNGWANLPVLIFYQPTKHPKGSNYFGLYQNETGQLMITDGISAKDNVWEGVLDENTNEVLYSAYRHDFQTKNDLMADGGPDYTRSSLHKRINFKIEEDSIVLYEVKPNEIVNI